MAEWIFLALFIIGLFTVVNLKRFQRIRNSKPILVINIVCIGVVFMMMLINLLDKFNLTHLLLLTIFTILMVNGTLKMVKEYNKHKSQSAKQDVTETSI